jgi:hypothetical protein
MTLPPLLVISCDRYSDLWEPFFRLLRARWPDCPFPLYLGTNHKTCAIDGVTTINIGDDISWTSGVRAMLEQLDSDVVILFLEDFFLKEPVETAAVIRLVDAARTHHVGTLRLAPLPAPTPLPRVASPVEGIGVVQPGEPYRVSTQPAIWCKETLHKLLVPGFSAWDFEHLGTQLSAELDDQFWGPLTPSIVYDHGVEKGKWKPEGVAICRSAGVEPDLAARPIFTDAELQSHLAAAEPAMREYMIQRDAIDAFTRGERVTGLRLVARGLRRRPAALPLWALVPFGIAGPRAVKWLRHRHLHSRIAAARRSVEQKLRRSFEMKLAGGAR